MNFEDEEPWLRGCIIRTLLRFAKDTRVEVGLRDVIPDAERRLEHLQRQHIDPFEDAPGG